MDSRRSDCLRLYCPDRLGLIYTDEACVPTPSGSGTDFSCAPSTLKWSFHLNGEAVTHWSDPETLLTSTTSFNDTGDPFGSHFTTAVDQAGNIHLVTRRNSRLVYLCYKGDGANSAWEPYRFLTSANDTVNEYPQISLKDPTLDAKVRIIYQQKTPDQVLCIQKSVNNYAAPDGTNTGFTQEGASIDDNLMVGSQNRYPGNPRLESPSYLNGFKVDGTGNTLALPFLRQYEFTNLTGEKRFSAVNYQFLIP